MKNLPYIILLTFILIGSGILLISKIQALTLSNDYFGNVKSAFSQIGDYMNDVLNEIAESESKSKQAPLSAPRSLNNSQDITNDAQKDEIDLNNINSQSSLKVTVNGKEIINKTTKITPKPAKSCYRYTVPHLDGSSSNLCYSKLDYNQLVTLNSQYNSAKANYDFEVRIAQMYSDPPSDFFQKSADEAKHKAQEWKDKMGQIALQMYNIENRGW